MDKLQKIMKGVWRYKERIVLAVLLCVLAYRVYELFVPKTLEASVQPPSGEYTPPEIAPNPETPDAPGQYNTLVRRSPFSYYSDEIVDPNEITLEELGLELLSIREVSGKWRARIKTKTAKKMVRRGRKLRGICVRVDQP